MYAIQKIEQPKTSKVLYRYTDPPSWKEDALCLERFEVIKETKSSYYILFQSTFYFPYDKKRVPKQGKNLFAFDTKEKALFNCYKRKERQVAILTSRLKEAQSNFNLVKYLLKVEAQYEQENSTSVLINKLKEKR